MSFAPSRAWVAAAAAVVLLAGAQPLAAQRQSEEFRWTGDLATGRTLHVRNLNGPVRIEGGGRSVEIVATKRWRRGEPEQVEIEVQRTGAGDRDLLVCAVYEGGRCAVSGYRARREGRRRGGDDDQVSVEFVVRVPQGALVDASTVNGELRITDVSAAVRANTVNGSISANSSGGPVTANTVNGSITVRMGSSGSTEHLSYETVNGSIVVEIPEGLSAEIDMSTVNGRLASEFPLTVQGSINPRRIRATIGEGGRRLTAKTVNGSISLKRVR